MEWNQTAADYPRDQCIHQLFEDQVARTPEAVAVEFEDIQVTYWELNELANRLAHHLQKLEVRPETLVGLYLEQSVEMVVGLLGILKAGCAYVPLDPEYPIERLEFMLQDTAIQVLVTKTALSQRLSNPGQVVYLDGDRKIVEKGADRNPVSLTQAKNLAYVMYTSGSTGQPKGVCVTHRAVIRLVRGTSYAKFSSEEVFLQLAPIGFDASTFEIWGALLHGARLVVLKAQQPTLDEIGEAIRLYQITSLWLTAEVFHIMVSERIEALKPLRQLLAGGDVLSLPHVETARHELSGCRLVNGYGPTEGTTFSCCYEIPLEEALGDTVPIGRPISNTTIYILDAHQQPVPIGVRGELYIGGDGLARGYWKRPGLTAEKFAPHPFTNQSGTRLYKTGDWARYRPDGHIEFLGRMDNQVKIHGYRIELSEIEATLEQQESVRQAIVLTRETALGDKQLVAYVIPAKKGALANEELRAKLAAKLPEYMIPNLYVLLEAYPLTPNGKVDRKALPPPVWKKTGRTETTVAPRTHTEQKLAEIWCQLLGLEEVAIHDHFFYLGGHSLLAMRLTSRIHLVLGVNLPISEIFEAPTLEALAKRIEALPVDSDSLPLPPLTERVSQRVSPASYAQERMWFLQQSTPTSAVYNQSFLLRMRGHLRTEALKCSLQVLEERHEPLRTTFALVGNKVEQHVQPASAFPLTLDDLHNLPPVEREGRLWSLASQEASRLFDLSRGPLWRCRLFRLGGTEHVLLLTFHHICMDEWSLRTFGRELSKLYASLAAERVVKLTPLACRYIDYAQWQRQWMESQGADNQLEYWRTKLGSELSALNLPTDYSRLSAPNERGATERRLLSPSLLKRLKKLSGEHEMTLFMTLLGAFQVLLYRYTGQDDVVVGTPIANRDSSKFEGLVGLFLNTIVMRCDLSGQPTVREMLLRVRKMTLEAFAHRDVPFEKVVQTVRELREGNTAPLFQVMFVLKNLEEHAMPLGPLETTLSTVSTGTAKFDLTLFLEAKTEGLQAVMEYRTDLFKAGTIQWMLRNLEVLLTGMVTQPKMQIAKLPLLTEAERQQPLVGLNQTAADYPRDQCIHQLFEDQVARTPEAVAVEFEDIQMTYHALNQQANQLGHYLHTLGVGPEVRVGLCVARSLDMVVGLLAILKAGGVCVPLDPTYPSDRLTFMGIQANLPVLLTTSLLCDHVLLPHAAVICLDTEWAKIAHERIDNLQTGVAAANLLYVLYTSGSTGRPKGVALPHAALVNLIAWQQTVLPTGRRTLQFASMSFDASFFEIFSTWCFGGTVIVASEDQRRDTKLLLQCLAVQRIERAVLPSILLSHLVALEGQEGDFTALRDLITTGDQLHITPAIVTFFTRLTTCRLHNHYGPSESHVVTAYTLSSSPETWSVSPPIGFPIANTQLCLVDNQGFTVPPGVVGELYISGVCLARGYLNQPDLTAERFQPCPVHTTSGARAYQTGDHGRYDCIGAVHFLGRRDHQVKLRGYRIELGEIEAALKQHPNAQDAVVLCREDVPGEKELVAYVTTDQKPIDVQTLRASLRAQLPDYMMPGAFVLLEQLPLTPNGKIDRKALPAPEGADRTQGMIYIAPRTTLEELLVEMWCKLLKVEHLSVHANFFALGGHSLLATQVVSRVYQAFEVELPLRVFFEKPTVAGLADFLTSAAVAGEEVVRSPLVPVSRQGQLPLSFAQERLWLLEQLEPGGTAYSMPAAFRLSGALNLSALEQSLFQLLQRHEVLRTSYAVVNEQPVQVIASGANFSLPVIDLEAHSPDEQESAVRQQIQTEHNRPFDLEQGPLVRVNLLRLASEEYVLLLVLHHSIADGLSLNILYREVATGYEAACHGEGGHRPPLPIQYGDYAVWQRHCLQGAALDLLLSYWTKQLVGAPPLLALPTDFPRPPLQTHRGAHHSIQLPEPVVSSLRALSQAEGVTMFMTLLAAFVLLLSRHAGQEDIVVGTPVVNRPRPELEEMIGLFLNTLVLRTNLAGDPTFRELLRRVQEVCLGAYANQELPFERLVEALQPERDLSRTPLFQVFFNFVHVSDTTWTLPGLTVSPLRGAHETEKFDLTLYVFLTSTGATVRWSYNSDLFDASTIAWMADQYQTVLRHLHETLEKPISTVAVLREEERARLLAPLACDCITQPFVAFPEAALAQSIPTRFEAQVHQRPDQVAVQTSQYRWTYEEVNRRANQIAHTLLAQKFPAETRVALLCAHDAPMVTAIVGVLKAGYAYVPLDPSFPPARLETIVSDAQVQAVLTESAYLPVALMLGEAAGQVLTIDEALDETNTRNPQHLVSPDTLAYVLYTSGTTGVPKGVMQSHRHVLHHIRVYTNNLHLRTEDRLTLLASYGFDAAVMDLFGALLNGATLYPFDLKEADPATLSAWLQQHAITFYHSTPTVFRYWTTALNGFAPLPALRLIVLGGEGTNLADFEAYQRHFGPDCLFVNGLGPTESTVSLQFVADHTTKIIGQTVPVGHPVEHTEVTLLNQEGQETEVYGEIAIRSPYVAIGYWHQPELTQRVFDPATEPGRARRYRTGDMGRRRSDGSLEFMGRKDTQIKLRGYRIELREIEAVLRQQPAVQEAVVLSREDTPGEKYLVAYVVAVKEHLASSELRAAIAVQLPEYMLPGVFVLLEAFPLTPNGKIDRKALPTPEAADRTHGTNYVAPRTVLEELLVDVWQEVLQVERIGIHDHFFELGGHSLLATRVIARLRNVLDLDIPLRSLFEQPTVAEFAMAIDLRLGRLFSGLGNG